MIERRRFFVGEKIASEDERLWISVGGDVAADVEDDGAGEAEMGEEQGTATGVEGFSFGSSRRRFEQSE